MPCLKQMVEVYNKLGGNLVAVMDVPREHTDRYGILKTGGESRGVVEALGLVEKPKPDVAPSTLSIIGRYILQPEVMDHLGAQEPGAGGEIQLTDAMAKMTGRGRFHGLRFKGRRFDCGDKIGWIEANMAFAIRPSANRQGGPAERARRGGGAEELGARRAARTPAARSQSVRRSRAPGTDRHSARP